MIKNIVFVGLGGMVGSIIRYLIYLAYGNTSFPYATMFINIAGSFFIGAIAGYATRNMAFAEWRLFLATGVCGGFTTFSAFSIECVQLVQQNRNIAALTYAISSLLFGVAAAFAGYIFTR